MHQHEFLITPPDDLWESVGFAEDGTTALSEGPDDWPDEIGDPDPFTDDAEYREQVPPVPAEVAKAQGTDDELLEKLEALLLDTDGLDGIDDPEPLIHNDILFRDTINWLVGKPGHGKSFVMIDQAGAVGTGIDWQGNPVTQGRVLYLVAEGARGIKKRVRAWEKTHGRKMTGVDFLPVPVQATNRRGWATLIRLAAKRRYIMIVLDTQARVTVGIEENSNKEMGIFVHQAEALRAAGGSCVVIVHHIGRNGDTGRGATTLDGALTTIMKASKTDHVVTLECTKNKDAEEWPQFDMTLTPVGDSAVLKSTVRISGNLIPGPSTAALQTSIKWWEHHGDAFVSIKTLEASLEAKYPTLARHTQDLYKVGIAERRDAAKGYQFRLHTDPSLPR